MNWNKFSVEDRSIPTITGFAVVLVLASLYMQSMLVLFLAVFFLLMVLINFFYFRNIGERLFLQENSKKQCFFIKEKGDWNFSFENKGWPILNAELTVFFDHYTNPENEGKEPTFDLYEVRIPFSIFTNHLKDISIPFKASRRGIARIRKLEIRIPSLFGFGEMLLENRMLLEQKVVVYPQPITVKGLNEFMTAIQGNNPVPFSVYEDRQGPLGTRDYLSTDSFNRIHWKASARKQHLQTKVYERIAEKGCTISINVSDGYAITSNLEKLLSSVTEFAYFAYSKQLPYSLCINVRTAGSTPFYYIPKGEGKEHLQNVLETLSSIDYRNTTFPYEKMLSFYNRHYLAQPYFIHGGNKTAAQEVIFVEMQRKGSNILEFNIKENHVVLSRLERLEGRVRL